MRTETGTFELRDNDMMMRELTYAETNEVAGGVGTAQVVGTAQSGAGSSITTNSGTFTLATSNTTATAAIAGNFHVTGPNNFLALQAVGVVS
jgi:hypothetical protein